MSKKFISISFILIISCCIFYCSKQDIKVGFVGSLTGTFSDLGVAGRNGAILRVEEINKKGGINGRKIELIIKDDAGQVEKTLERFKELKQEGVVAVIGPTLSGNALHILPYINEEKLLTIGATNTSMQLGGMDDYYFRVSQQDGEESILQAQFLIENNKYELTSVLDYSNKSFAESWYGHFKREYEKLGGKILNEIIFNSIESPSYSSIATEIIEQGCDALLTVSSGISTAALAQQLNIREFRPFFITSSWAKTEEFIRQGGRAIEGIYTSHIFDEDNLSENQIKFDQNYQNRFRTNPTFSSRNNYEAIGVLCYALRNIRNINSDNIKKELLNIELFEGIQGNFTFDEYGDVEREGMQMFKVHNGKFVSLNDL